MYAKKALLAKVNLQERLVNGDSNATPIQIQQLSQLACVIVRSYAMLQLVNENVTCNMIIYVKLYWKFEIGKKVSYDASIPPFIHELIYIVTL